MNWIKTIIKFVLYLIYLIIVVFILLEIIFRVVPVSDSLKVKPVNMENPIRRFEENRDITKQIGFNFSHVNKKHINNYGYLTNRDFSSKTVNKRPVIAVVGDSYVEALQVKNSETFHAKLDDKFRNFDVYPIGMSGSPLSQYLAFARYAQNEFDPDVFVFLIIANDFDESFYKTRKKSGFHYFDAQGSLERIDYRPSGIKQLARKSAFLRYLHLDLKISVQISRMLHQANLTGSVAPRYTDTSAATGILAIDNFLQGIRQLTSNSKVILMLDGDRNSIYNGGIERDAENIEQLWYADLINKANGMPNLYLVDLQSYFQNDWKLNKKRFDHTYDSHWNEHGHSVAADALAEVIDQF